MNGYKVRRSGRFWGIYGLDGHRWLEAVYNSRREAVKVCRYWNACSVTQ